MDSRGVNRASGLFVAALAAGYVLLSTYPHGAGITSDSIHYLTAARHLIEEGKLTTYTGAPLVSYAPMLSVGYALLSLAGMDMQLTARLVSAFSFATVVWITWRWLAEMRVRSTTLWAAAGMVLLARPLLWYAPYALSELPFVALTMCGLWQAWRYAKVGARSTLVMSGVCTGLSVLTRWIGVTTVEAVSVFVLLVGCGHWRRLLTLATAYVIATLLPFLLWISRNRLLTGTFFGIREPSDYPFGEMVFDTLWSLHRWVVPVTFENSVSLFAVSVGLGAVVLGLALRLQWCRGDEAIRKGVILLTVHIGLFAIALTTMARGAKFEALSERLWSPIAVPLVVCLVLIWNLLRLENRLTQLARGLLLAMAIGWSVSGLVFGAGMLVKSFQGGPGVFNTSAWRDSMVIRWLRAHPPDGKVYTNFPEPLYYLTGIVAEHVPHKGPMRVASETRPRNLQQFLQAVLNDRKNGHKVYIVWFANPTRSEYLYSLEELHKHLSLRSVKKFSDGAVYEVDSADAVRRG